MALMETFARRLGSSLTPWRTFDPSSSWFGASARLSTWGKADSSLRRAEDIEAVPLSKTFDHDDEEDRQSEEDRLGTSGSERTPDPAARRRRGRIRNMALALFLIVLLGSAILVGARPTGPPSRHRRRLTNDTETNFHLQRGAPILGYYDDCRGSRTTWLSRVPDGTPFARLNIPGTHDTATWNYSEETQQRLLPITGQILPAEIFRCQDQSIFQSLAEGIRAVDLRIGFLPDRQSVGFYHGTALLSDTATLEDVLFGFYAFLDDHPSETLLLSIKIDNTTWQPSDRAVEDVVYNLTTSGLGKEFWLQNDASLTTLGAARGQITFLRRLDWSSLQPASAFPPIGVPIPPPVWPDNQPDWSVVYNPSTAATAYVEDYYEIGGPLGVDSKVSQKYNATTTHLDKARTATGDSANQLFITFASAEKDDDIPPVTPQIMALGDGKVTGVNQRLLAYLTHTPRRSRLGVVMLDWFHSVDGLVDSLIRLQ